MTKAQEIQQRVDALIAAGTPRADAFKQLAGELGIKLDSVRGAYYTAVKASGGEGRPSRTRRRETTPEDALADAGLPSSARWKPSTERSRQPTAAPKKPRPKPTR